MDQAKQDILLGIESGIVHKYVIDNAPDIMALVNLYKACSNNTYLFGILHTVSHTMVNPIVILELTQMIDTFNENFVQLKRGNQWIDVDIWAKAFGTPFGDHAQGFHKKLFS